MWKPSAYDWVYPLSYLFTFSIATPHSILIQLAYPKGNLAQGEPLGKAPCFLFCISRLKCCHNLRAMQPVCCFRPPRKLQSVVCYRR